MQTDKHFSILLLVIVAVLAGWFGSWLFSWLAGPMINESWLNRNKQIIVQDAKKVVVEQNQQITATVDNLQQVLVGLYPANKQDIYELGLAPAQALIITSDGWLLTNQAINTDWVAVTKDKDIYHIDQVVNDSNFGFYFLHIANVKNLPVSRFTKINELQIGQTVININWLSASWLATLSDIEKKLFYSSENSWRQLSLSPADQLDSSLVVADLGSRIIGLINQQGQLYNTDYIVAMINNLLADQPLAVPYLGVHYENLSLLTNQTVKNGVKLTSMAGLTAVVPKSPAAQAGLQANDILLSINNTILDQDSDLAELLLNYEVGDTVIINYLRDNQEFSVEITLGSK